MVLGPGGLGSSVGFGGLWDSGALWDSGGSVGLCGSLWSLWSLCLGSRGSGVSNRKSLGFGVSGLVEARKNFLYALGRDFCVGKGLGVFKVGIFWVPDRGGARGGGRTNYHGMKAKSRYG